MLIPLLVILSTSLGVRATTLAKRLHPRNCNAALVDAPFAKNVPFIRKLLLRQVHEVFEPEDGGVRFLFEDEPLAPSYAFERAFRVDELLGFMAVAGGLPTFGKAPVDFGQWQAEAWPLETSADTPRVWMLMDRLDFDLNVNALRTGEFILQARYHEEFPVEDLERAIAEAVRTARFDPSIIRGLRSDGNHPTAGDVYFMVDLPGDPAARFRQTLRLMKLLNAELKTR